MANERGLHTLLIICKFISVPLLRSLEGVGKKILGIDSVDDLALLFHFIRPKYHYILMLSLLMVVYMTPIIDFENVIHLVCLQAADAVLRLLCLYISPVREGISKNKPNVIFIDNFLQFGIESCVVCI